MDASQMASPQQPQPTQQPQISPGNVSGVDPEKLKQALQMCIQSAVNQQGYVDMNKLVQVWPQVSQQLGLNIPFQSVLQMIQQNPEIMDDIINQMGLAGIIKDGKSISADELMQMSGGGQTAGGVGGASPVGG